MTNHKIIAMTGATGFVGTNMTRSFKDKGWEVIPLGRNDFKLSKEELSQKIKGISAVINLAGAPVISRWSESYKKEMYESRVTLTKKLVASIELLDEKPHVFLSSSAIGCYTEEGTHTEEENVMADDFLGNLTKDWEIETNKAKNSGIRTVIFRFGVVLGNNGGALAKMLLPFKTGLGGVIGSGKQPFSWIHISDLINIFTEALDDTTFEGVYNMTSPTPTTNRGFTKALGKVLKRPTLFPVPEFMLRIIFGEGAQIITSGQSAIPKRLLDRNFNFDFPQLDSALKNLVE